MFLLLPIFLIFAVFSRVSIAQRGGASTGMGKNNAGNYKFTWPSFPSSPLPAAPLAPAPGCYGGYGYNPRQLAPLLPASGYGTYGYGSNNNYYNNRQAVLPTYNTNNRGYSRQGTYRNTRFGVLSGNNNRVYNGRYYGWK